MPSLNLDSKNITFPNSNTTSPKMVYKLSIDKCFSPYLIADFSHSALSNPVKSFHLREISNIFRYRYNEKDFKNSVFALIRLYGHVFAIFKNHKYVLWHKTAFLIYPYPQMLMKSGHYGRPKKSGIIWTIDLYSLPINSYYTTNIISYDNYKNIINKTNLDITNKTDILDKQSKILSKGENEYYYLHYNKWSEYLNYSFNIDTPDRKKNKHIYYLKSLPKFPNKSKTLYITSVFKNIQTIHNNILKDLTDRYLNNEREKIKNILYKLYISGKYNVRHLKGDLNKYIVIDVEIDKKAINESENIIAWFIKILRNNKDKKDSTIEGVMSLKGYTRYRNKMMDGVRKSIIPLINNEKRYRKHLRGQINDYNRLKFNYIREEIVKIINKEIDI